MDAVAFISWICWTKLPELNVFVMTATMSSLHVGDYIEFGLY